MAHSSTQRRHEVALTRVKVGHTFLTHSFFVSKDSAPICNKCLVDLNIQYRIIQECLGFLYIRNTVSVLYNLLQGFPNVFIRVPYKIPKALRRLKM